MITDTTIILYSKGYVTSLKKSKNTRNCIFTGQQYRILNSSLYLFTKKQEKRDKYSFYRQYFTLHKVE